MAATMLRLPFIDLRGGITPLPVLASSFRGQLQQQGIIPFGVLHFHGRYLGLYFRGQNLLR